MPVLSPGCCGIAGQAAQVTAGRRRVSDDGQSTTALVTCGTTSRARMALRTWWQEQQGPVVAMASPGVYGKPVYQGLRAAVEGWVAHSHDVRQRPGHKTAQRDAPWMAALLAHGLSKPSVVPPPEMRAWRDLTRPRVSLGPRRTQAKHRVSKIWEDPNITLVSVGSDGCGKSARRMVEAVVAGARDAATLSAMALGRVRRQSPQLAGARAGQCTAPHAKLMAGALEWVDVLGRQMAELAQQLQEWLGPMAPHLEQLDRLPGGNAITAREILAAIGLDMPRGGSASRLAAWAGLSPGNTASAGTRRQGRTRQGNRSLRRVVVQCAWATRKPSTFLGRTFRRLAARLGGKKAAVAVAHKIVGSIYHLRLEGTL